MLERGLTHGLFMLANVRDRQPRHVMQCGTQENRPHNGSVNWVSLNFRVAHSCFRVLQSQVYHSA